MGLFLFSRDTTATISEPANGNTNSKKIDTMHDGLINGAWYMYTYLYESYTGTIN